MAYTKTNWQNDQAPAINATNLNKIEQGIFDNDVNISGINETLGVDTNTWVGTTAYGEGDIVIYNDKIYQNITGTSTTTNPAEDTTNWDEITIFDTDSINDDLIDKTKFINNSSTNSGVETYSCDYLNGNILYNNSTGTSGNITLNDNIENYNTIKIFYVSPSTYTGIEECFIMPNATYTITKNRIDAGGAIIMQEKIQIVNNALSVVANRSFVISNGQVIEDSPISITKIIGYK